MAARYRQTSKRTSTSPAPPSSEPAQPIKQVARDADASGGFSVLDVLRVLGGLLLLSSGLSYLSSTEGSLTWGWNPWWSRAREWKALWHGSVSLTDAELAKYDGSDPSLPIYLALNGTIYDVSISPQTYGPGGSYHFFAGRDAARAFLTGCFADDTTPDLRGVEEMYMPVDPTAAEHPEAYAKMEAWKAARGGKALSRQEIKVRHAGELRKARKAVREGLEHWHVLFRGHKGKKYFRVGEVRREEGWLQGVEKRELCEQARKGRPVREYGE